MGSPVLVAAAPPYFAPYPGFFYRAELADVLVILDRVQFPLGTTWLTRNRFKNDQGVLWLSLPVWRKGRGLERIDEVELCYEGRWPRKHLETLKTAYAHAPFFADHLSFLAELFASRFTRLLDLNLAILQYLSQCLGLSTPLMLLSELGARGRGSSLLLNICHALGATALLVQSQAEKYLDAALFQQAGIELRPVRYRAPVYPQLWGGFAANLSAFDLLFNCGPRAREVMDKGQPAPYDLT